MKSARLPGSLRVALCMLAASTALAFARPAGAQDAGQHLIDFVHYTMVAKPRLAASHAQKLLDMGLTDIELTNELEELIVNGEMTIQRFDGAVDRARAVHEEGLSDTATELARRLEEGRRGLSREAERIKGAIQMLVGTLRQQHLGEGRLIAAGEYAVPFLLNEMIVGRDERLKLQVGKVLVKIGRVAVTPLSVALPELGDPNAQRVVCDILGQIGYPHAAPALWDLAQDSNAPDAARDAAARAFRQCDGVEGELSSLYTALGREYFRGAASLVAYPSEGTNNVWSYDMHTSLSMTPVPTPIFSDVMAMKMSSRALKVNPANAEALGLFVAADLKRENDLPDGEVDPVFGELQYSPDFYATVYGTTICMDVLAMGLDIVDTPLIRDAIGALAVTTGGANLFSSQSGEEPLLEALNYPDRRVQYEAALTLARALPEETFGNDHQVVPLLATAVRTGGESFAMVLADEAEDRRTLSGALEQIGFTVVGAQDTVQNLGPALASAVAVDVVVVMKSDFEATRSSVTALQQSGKTVAAPVVVLASADEPRLSLEFRGNRRVFVTRRSSDEALASAVDQAMTLASGGRITEAEAEEYAIQALSALRDIAINRSTVFSIRDAQNALLEALAARTGGVRMYVARILALIDDEVPQRALFDAALGATDTEQVELMQHLADSIKRFGTYAEPRHLQSLLRVIADAQGENAEAAATVHGAMNRRPTPAAVDLIP